MCQHTAASQWLDLLLVSLTCHTMHSCLGPRLCKARWRLFGAYLTSPSSLATAAPCATVLTARVPSSAMLSERVMFAPTPMHSTQSCSMTCSVCTAGNGQNIRGSLVASLSKPIFG